MIVGGKIVSVSAEKSSDDMDFKGFNLDVSVVDMELKGQLLQVSYSYVLEYMPKRAFIRMQGVLFFDGDGKKLSGIVEDWKKTKKLEPAFAEEMLNSVTHTGMVAGTLLSFAIGVPAPISGQKFAVSAEPQRPKKAG
ncbi:MAG: hypothetical protein V1787_03760 [Candidatus Micrarchaeota archaeon]